MFTGSRTSAEELKQDILDKRLQTFLPVFIDRNHPINVLALIDQEGTQIALDSATFFKAIEQELAPEIFTQIKARQEIIANKPWISIQALTEAGLETSFDQSLLEIHILIPAVIRKINTITVSGAMHAGEETRALTPSPFSGYLNLHTGQSQNTTRGALDGAVNYKNWVFEGAGNSESQFSTWKRGDLRLTRDNPDSMLRYSAGDVVYPVFGFQTFRPLGGIAVTTQFSLQPNRIITPLSRHEIFIKNPSTVKIWVNGRPVQTLRLAAGTHDLQDFPLTSGSNNVMLELTDDFGRRETLNFDYIHSELLLAKGIHQLAYAIGSPIITEDNSRLYEGSNPTASLSHYLGLTDQLTMGAYAQADREQILGGASSTVSTPIGTLTLETAGSSTSSLYSEAKGFGWRVVHSYSDYRGPARSPRTLSLLIESLSPRFASLGNLSPNNTAQYRLGASYTQQIANATVLNLITSYELNREEKTELANGRTVSLGLVQNWIPGLDTTLLFNHNRLSTRELNNSLMFILVWAFPEKNQYLNATVNTDNAATHLQWNYNSTSSRQVGGYNLAVGAGRSNTQKDLDVTFNYLGNRARVDAGYTTTSAADIAVSSAIVFADNHFAISRPVTDSFVLVKPERALKDQKIQINPQDEDHFEAQADGFGPAVMPELTAYRYQYIQIGAPALPIGLSLPQENFVLFPTYKSGFAVELSTDAVIFLSGTLINIKGDPISLATGEAHPISTLNTTPIPFFTNREGRFGIEGIKPGEYELVLLNEAESKTTLIIPNDTRGIFYAGLIQLKAGK